MGRGGGGKGCLGVRDGFKQPPQAQLPVEDLIRLDALVGINPGGSGGLRLGVRMALIRVEKAFI